MHENMQSETYDIAVVGGGPSGRIAALALARQGFSTALIAPAESSKDGRTTALWQQSIDLLRKLGVWDRISGGATPLKKMRMVDDTNRLIRAPEVVFDSAELGLEEFGFNLLNSELNSVLEKSCADETGLTSIADIAEAVDFKAEGAVLRTRSGRFIEAKLIVAADGRHSKLREAAGIQVRRWTYPQNALVLNLEHSLPHQHVSTEFHTPTGPFTLVPLEGRRSSLVCVVTEEGANELLSMKPDELEAELERRSHSVLGRLKLDSKPQCFPLSGLSSRALVANRLALVGEAAHVFPPIGAQGLNLSLRDIIDLSAVLALAQGKLQDIGELSVLKNYETRRLQDIRSRTGAVDALNRSLLTDFLPVQIARSASMYLAGKLGPFRKLLMKEGMAPGTGFRLRS